MESPDSLLQGLLKCYSPSTRERGASEYLVQQMGSLGFDRAFVDESGSAVGILGDGERQIVLLGHIDTVPGYIEVVERAGKLYGRGSVDAKGPLATFTAAAARAGRQPNWQIVVIGAVEEEAASSKGAHFARSQYQPELCVIGEPSRWDHITLGYKGRLLLDYHFSRTITHTARKDRSAPEQAVTFWNELNAEIAVVNADREKAFDQILSSLRSIHSSEDGFREDVTMTVGFRLPMDVSPDAMRARVLAHADGAKIEFRGEEPAYKCDPRSPLVRLFNNAIRDAGGKPGYLYKTGTSDMNVVGPVWSCPLLAYGPGNSTLDHTPEEHIELEEYHRAIEVVTGVLCSLSSL
ncbi:MAG TPA: [LysW]-lysine hydrolase [Aggregatilineales bacterium]|nr:[LysW]-lysine hydrolase [Aggregatilineales bacterium]